MLFTRFLRHVLVHVVFVTLSITTLRVILNHNVFSSHSNYPLTLAYNHTVVQSVLTCHSSDLKLTGELN